MNIFITGGTSGIGLQLAKKYLEEGHRVGVCGRNLSKLPSELSKEFSDFYAYEVNVIDGSALKMAINSFCGDDLDLIIANAGRSVGDKSKIPNFEVACEIIDTNVKGVLNAFSAAIPLMMKRGKGQIVAIASVAGFVGLPGAGPYSASKAAVLKLCESYAIDLKQFGITVTAIAPGFIDTPLTKQNHHSMPFLMNANKGAELIKRAIEKKKILYIFPLPMRIVITLLDKMPRGLYRWFMHIPFFNYSK